MSRLRNVQVIAPTGTVMLEKKIKTSVYNLFGTICWKELLAGTVLDRDPFDG